MVVDVVVDDPKSISKTRERFVTAIPFSEHWVITGTQLTDVLVVLTVPETLICNTVEQSVTVAEQDEEEDVEEGSVLVGSLSLFGSGSLTGGLGLNRGLSG